MLAEGSGAGPLVVVFPHAGGSGRAYRPLVQRLALPVEIRAVELPGRDRRLAEPPFRGMEALVAALPFDSILPPGRPVLFYGHSLGALVAFEIARRLGPAGPRRLVLSGRGAPGRPVRRPDAHLLPDAELVAELRHYGGTEPELLACREFMKILLPAIRADFEMAATYRAPPPAPLQARLTCLGGRDDPDVTPDDLAAWSGWGGVGFRAEVMEGGHFFPLASPRFRDLLAEEILGL